MVTTKYLTSNVVCLIRVYKNELFLFLHHSINTSPSSVLCQLHKPLRHSWNPTFPQRQQDRCTKNYFNTRENYITNLSAYILTSSVTLVKPVTISTILNNILKMADKKNGMKIALSRLLRLQFLYVPILSLTSKCNSGLFVPLFFTND